MYKAMPPARSSAQMEPVSVKVQEYWSFIVRRKWVVIASILVGVILAAALCVVLPKSYRSSTLILVETQKIPDEYVKSIGRGNIEDRLMMIRQQVMSRAFLSHVLDEDKLYEGAVQREGQESVIEKLRRGIKVETARNPDGMPRTAEPVTLSFADEDPVTAMKVTEKLAALFIEENLRDREQLVTGVSAFLEQELQEAKKALDIQAQAISQYKTKYVGLLPDHMEANLRTLDRLHMEVNATEDLLRSQAIKISSVENSMNAYQASGAVRVESDEPRSLRKQGDPLVARLFELERQLTALRAEWKETYPDISEVKHEIQSVKAQLAEKYGPSSGEKPVDRATAYDPNMMELIKQRNDLRAEMSATKDRRARLTELIKDKQRLVEQTPSHEQELMILVRDYENMQKNYQALMEKRLNARVAVNLEKGQKGEQLRVLDHANLPKRLDSPNRLLIMALGLLGGCGLGVGLAIGLDHLNPTFRRREEVELLPDVRVLATIPQFLVLPYKNGGGVQPMIGDGEAASKALMVNSTPNLSLVAKWQPRSIAAEQYRMAATRLVLTTERRQSTVIEVTSALEGEGKTTTVVNLGYTIARDLGRRTLLIDCDFRRPALHKYVSVPPRAGLVDLLDGHVSLEECLSRIDEVPCAIMTVGRSEDERNELGRIEQFRAILPQLRAQFQYLIINTPPVLASATMGILAHLADEVVMVIKAGSSPQHVVQKAFTLLNLIGERQVVLNGVDEHSLPHYLYGYKMPYSGESVAQTVAR